MKVEELVKQEEAYLQKEYKKRITAGYFAKRFGTYAYQEQKAGFEDFLREEWQWSVLRKIRDSISDKLFVGEKAAITSDLFLKQTTKVEDYGGFAIREGFGEVCMCQVATFSMHVVRKESGRSDKQLVEDERGLLLYFPNVNGNAGTENLILHTNKETDNNEICEELGIPQKRTNLMLQFMYNVASELQGNGNRLEVPEGPFAKEFRKHFDIECKDASYAAQIMNDALMENILTLRKVIGGGISVSYVGSDIYLFIHGCEAFIRGWCSANGTGVDTNSVRLMDMLLNHTGDLLELLLPMED